MRTTILPLAFLLVACGGSKEEPKTQASVPETHASASVPSTTTELPANTGTGQKLEEKKTDPGRSPEEIRALILTRREESRRCYDEQKKLHPKLEGQVSVGFTIDVKGKVTDVALDSEQTTLTDEKVTTCLVSFIKTFTFPESARGMESKIRYPFVFTRGKEINAK